MTTKRSKAPRKHLWKLKIGHTTILNSQQNFSTNQQTYIPQELGRKHLFTKCINELQDIDDY